jgi:hypothetical protein
MRAHHQFPAISRVPNVVRPPFAGFSDRFGKQGMAVNVDFHGIRITRAGAACQVSNNNMGEGRKSSFVWTILGPLSLWLPMNSHRRTREALCPCRCGYVQHIQASRGRATARTQNTQSGLTGEAVAPT